jgi:hypothetical protein
MAQAWDLVQHGHVPAGYPPGFPILLAPFALLGSHAFVLFARWAPPLFGAVEVLGVYLLCRHALGHWPAVAGALVAALMPENVFRTSLLFPTAMDLALLPFVLLAVLQASEGSRRALVTAGILGAVLLVTHPWVVALLVPTVGLFSLTLVARRQMRRAVPVAAATATGGVALAAALAFLPGTWNPMPAFFRHAGPKLLSLVASPASIFPLPRYVDLPSMLTWSAIVLAGVGAVCALLTRRRFGFLALVWTVLLLPVVFVDWFGVWFIPHRTVAYLSLGVAMLAAVAVATVISKLPSRIRLFAGAASCAVVVMLLAPSALAVAPWYRIYDHDDERAWRDLDAQGVDYVIAASWQSAAGYRATTGHEAKFSLSFFHDGAERSRELAKHPNLVVLVDAHAKENELSVPSGFHKIGEWGDVSAYKR